MLEVLLLKELPTDYVVVLRLGGPGWLWEGETLEDTLALFPSAETLCIQENENSPFGWEVLRRNLCDNPVDCRCGFDSQSALLPRLHRLVLRSF